MRGTVPGLPTPVPLAEQLPAVYQEDPFTVRFTAGLDEVLAPVFHVLACLDAYVDPIVAPEDFVTWLGSWVGIEFAENWTLERQRDAVAGSVAFFRQRGTVAGLQTALEILSGGDVTISETGGAAFSRTPGGEFPGEAVPRLAVRIAVDDPEAVNLAGLDALVVAAKPAHVVHRIEVVSRAEG